MLIPTPKNCSVSVKKAIQLLSTKLDYDAEPIFAALTVTGLTASALIGTNASKLLESVTIGTGLDYTRPTISLSHLGIEALTDPGADRILFWDDNTTACGWLAVGNSIVITDVTLDTIQDIQTSASPEFAGGTFTDVVTGVTPTAGVHLATKEYVDLALGARKTFFLSDTGSGVGALNYAYPHETGKAQSTIVTAPLGSDPNQLVKGFITEAGEPATTTLHAGVMAFHFHAKKGNSNQRITTLHVVLSRVDADGTSNKITITTSEVTAELTDTETVYIIHATLGSDVEIAATARLIIDVYANVTTDAQNSVVTFYMEGTEDSYFSAGVDSGIWQNHGDVLDDLNTLGEVGANSEFLVGTGVGALAWESGATARTSIGLGLLHSPQFTELTLNNSGGSVELLLQALATTDATIRLRNGASSKWTFGNDATNDEFIISTGSILGTPKVTILQDGKVGIGTGATAPNAPLEVKGVKPGEVGGHQSGQLQVTGSGGQFYCAVITGHNAYNTNTQLWYLGSTSASTHDDIAFINRQNAALHLATNNTTRVTIDASGNVTLAVIAAEGSDVDKFLVSSSGVIKYRTGAQVLSDIGGGVSKQFLEVVG